MNKFDIFQLDEEDALVVIMKSSDSPFDVIEDISKALNDRCFFGNVYIDELLHSGNNEERFIKVLFDGKRFDNTTFQFADIPRNDMIRSFVCKWLNDNPDFLEYTDLTREQQQLISRGVII